MVGVAESSRHTMLQCCNACCALLSSWLPFLEQLSYPTRPTFSLRAQPPSACSSPTWPCGGWQVRGGSWRRRCPTGGRRRRRWRGWRSARGSTRARWGMQKGKGTGIGIGLAAFVGVNDGGMGRVVVGCVPNCMQLGSYMGLVWAALEAAAAVDVLATFRHPAAPSLPPSHHRSLRCASRPPGAGVRWRGWRSGSRSCSRTRTKRWGVGAAGWAGRGGAGRGEQGSVCEVNLSSVTRSSETPYRKRLTGSTPSLQ